MNSHVLKKQKNIWEHSQNFDYSIISPLTCTMSDLTYFQSSATSMATK